jgi:hypothetical protein
MVKHRIHRVDRGPEPGDLWDGPYWKNAGVLAIDQCRPESSTHRPVTYARLAYDDSALHGMFKVQDRFVRCVRSRFQTEVWKDSCVEIFLQPPGNRYFNFEFSCGGAMYCAHRPVDKSTPAQQLTAAQCGPIRVIHSLPSIVDPEIASDCEWTLTFSIPFGVLEQCVGHPLPLSGTIWKGNLYKCGDETSHPHWLSWSPVPEVNFHLPDCFGDLMFL